MKITEPAPLKPKLIPLSTVPNYSVVRHNDKLFYKSTNSWVTLAMTEGTPAGLFRDDLVEVVDCELIVKS
jgi:hypothetical protein